MKNYLNLTAASEDFREPEETYRAVFENTGTAIIIFGEDTIITMANSEAERLSGYSRGDIIGKKSWTEFVLKEDMEKMRHYHAARSRDFQSAPQHYEFRLVNKWGSTRDIFLTMAPIPSTNRRVASLVDITERKKAEAALRESEQRYRRLFEDSKDMIIMSTPDGSFLDANPAALSALHCTAKSDLLGCRAAGTFFNERDWEELRQLMDRYGYVKNFEMTLNRTSGEPLSVLVTSTPLKNNDNEVIAYQSIMCDITERKKLEHQLFQSQKIESIGTLAGGIAHDFNNILAGILGYASFVKSKISERHEFYNHINTIELGAQRAAELTSQLLAFARGGQYNMSAVDLNTVVRETVTIISRTFDKSIEIETKLSDSLPPIRADSSQMQQVLMNLCVNARDAMTAGGSLTIETRQAKVRGAEQEKEARKSQYVALSVSDTGEGMDKAIQSRIFDPFFTTKEQGKGTGLGLSMVYGVINRHGGFTKVFSRVGEGTTVRVYLPTCEKFEAEPALPHISSGELKGSGGILVVEDEEDVRSFIAELCSEYGYQVFTAADGEQALSVYNEYCSEIDLVILDMIMPKMSGSETLLRLKNIDPDVKVVLASGYSSDASTCEAGGYGVCGFIQKPFQMAELLSMIRNALAS